MARANVRKQTRASAPAKKPKLTAKTADKHVLYQQSVQDAPAECVFIDKVFKKLRGREPQSLREDFCGTALLTSTWVGRGEERTGVGIDIDRKVLDWGIEHNLEPVGEPGDRVTLYCQDVRDSIPEKVDVIGAFNFSYWVFMTRDAMRDYFERVRKGLNRDGVFVLDAYGGWESQQPMLERRIIPGGFTYVWDQNKFCPVSHRVTNYIHFHFKDGTQLDRAFTYEWRYWTLPELTELLTEAGYSSVTVYWDMSDDEEHEDYRPRTRAENQPGWLAYIVAAR